MTGSKEESTFVLLSFWRGVVTLLIKWYTTCTKMQQLVWAFVQRAVFSLHTDFLPFPAVGWFCIPWCWRWSTEEWRCTVCLLSCINMHGEICFTFVSLLVIDCGAMIMWYMFRSSCKHNAEQAWGHTVDSDYWFLVDSWFKQKLAAGLVDSTTLLLDSTSNQAGVVDLKLILGWPLI
jgi:hypothetical protein